MKILSLNPGSTSLKSSLFEFGNGDLKLLARIENSKDFPFHIKQYTKQGFIRDLKEIDQFGVRVVHGGSFFHKTTRIDESVLEKIKQLSELAPLHNPPAVKLIETIQKQTTNPVWAAFDTAFHQTIPDYISHYPLSPKLTKDLSLQQYGFHGLAVESLLRQRKKEGPLPQKIIVCHLGGGDSVTAVKAGKSLNNSMGFTPLRGLMMVSRSGTVNAGVFVYLKEKLNLSDTECLDLLNHHAGLSGYTGKSDIKDIFDEAEKKTQSLSGKAVAIFSHRVCEFIWNYYGLLGGCDELIFSGGIGRRNAFARQEICKNLSVLGVKIDTQKNSEISEDNFGIISRSDSQVLVRVMKADETGEIAQQITNKV